MSEKKLREMLICQRLLTTIVTKVFLTHKNHEENSFENIKNTEVLKIYDFYEE